MRPIPLALLVLLLEEDDDEAIPSPPATSDAETPP
jgi:hypothetical protein